MLKKVPLVSHPCPSCGQIIRHLPNTTDVKCSKCQQWLNEPIKGSEQA